MSDIAQLKSEIAKIDEQIATLQSRKDCLDSELKEAERKLTEDTINKIVGELKALNLAPEDIARALGLSVAAQPQKKPRAARGTATLKVKGIPRYRSSIDPSLTWTGKGRKPGWIQTFVDNGGNLDDWLIKE